ncbi:MAG: hypothetical protein IPK11_17760 [Ignavibacteria bacterium]|nr:hypothetical protein [Ignavibacteria bacterium]
MKTLLSRLATASAAFAVLFLSVAKIFRLIHGIPEMEADMAAVATQLGTATAIQIGIGMMIAIMWAIPSLMATPSLSGSAIKYNCLTV